MNMLCHSGIVTIAIYGFLKNFCPDGFYLSNILFSPPKNLTVDEVTQEVYSVVACANLVFTFVALLVTDILQYKTIIIIGALAAAIKCPVLYFGRTVTHIQIAQSLHALYRASQVAYRTYIYTQVQKHNYQKVTAVVHITPKLGTLVSALLAQFLLSTQSVTFQNLILVSFVGLGASFLTALALPAVEGTAYSKNKNSQEKQDSAGCLGYHHAACLLWEELRFASSNINTLKWCVCWILSNGASQMVSDYYVQALWNDVTGDKHNSYNAGVEAIYACCSTMICCMVGKLTIDWQKHGEIVIAICTIVQAVALFASAQASSIIMSYGLYITVSMLYDMMTVISNSQIALQVKNDGFGLIFGINTFLSIGFQGLLTYVLTSKNTLALPIRKQFVAIGVCFAVLGVIFLAKTISTIISSRCSTGQPTEPKTNGITKTTLDNSQRGPDSNNIVVQSPEICVLRLEPGNSYNSVQLSKMPNGAQPK